MLMFAYLKYCCKTTLGQGGDVETDVRVWDTKADAKNESFPKIL